MHEVFTNWYDYKTSFCFIFSSTVMLLTLLNHCIPELLMALAWTTALANSSAKDVSPA